MKKIFIILFLMVPTLSQAQILDVNSTRSNYSRGTGNHRPIKKTPYKTTIDPTYQGEINEQLGPIVIFQEGKSSVDGAQMASVEVVFRYMESHPDAKVLICGYASKDSEARLGQKLSEDRAMAVKQILIRQYRIDANRLIANGKGATDKLSETPDFNQAVIFYSLP